MRERRLLWILAVAAVAIVGAFAVRAGLQRRKLQEAEEGAQAALARDTYGGFRDCDVALRSLVTPGSPHTHLALERAYALAELAAHYDDDQAGVESKLLLGPIEIQLDKGGLTLPPGDLSRFYAAAALVALGDRAPGDALLALGKVPEEQSSAELLAVRSEAESFDERNDLAEVALDAAAKKDPTSLEVLRLAAGVTLAAHRPVVAAELYRRLLAANPKHVPSLVALAELAADGTGDRAAAAESLGQMSSLIANEGGPDEQCRALAALARLDLELGHPLAAPGLIDRAAEVEDAPPRCQVELAALDRQLGRDEAARALLTRAAAGRDPGDALLALAEAQEDPLAALALSRRPPPADLRMAQKYVWEARAAAVGVRADVALGRAKEALALADALSVDTVPAKLGGARLSHARGEDEDALTAIGDASTLARAGQRPGDALAEVGETSLSLGQPAVALRACDAAAAAAAGNCRALLCAARALHALGREAEARQRIDRVRLVNPDADGAEALATEVQAAAERAASRPARRRR